MEKNSEGSLLNIGFQQMQHLHVLLLLGVGVIKFLLLGFSLE